MNFSSYSYGFAGLAIFMNNPLPNLIVQEWANISPPPREPNWPLYDWD